MPEPVTQIKFTLEADIVTAFRRRCAEESVSLASMIREWMKTGCPGKGVKGKTLTRPLRKKTVLEITRLLQEILQKEEQYRDAIPEQFTQRYDAADQTCEQLAEAITYLEEAFS